MAAYQSRKREDLTDEEKQANRQLGFKVRQRLSREWLFLKGSELKLAQFVLAHSLEWGKPSTHWHPQQAVDAGLGMSERSLYRAMKSLKKRGLLSVKTGRGPGWHFSLNPGWNPVGNVSSEAESAGKIVPIRAPKRAASPVENTENEAPAAPENGPETALSSTAKMAVGDCQNGSDPKTDPLPVQTVPLLTSFGAVDAPGEPDDRPVTSEENGLKCLPDEKTPPIAPAPPAALPAPRHAAKPPVTRAEKSGKRPRTIETFERFWRAAIKEEIASGRFPETMELPRWNLQAKGMVAVLAPSWNQEKFGPFENFLQFAISSWEEVIRTKFTKLPDAPRFPVIEFLFTRECYRSFLEAFCHGESLKWAATLPDSERRVCTLMIETGMAREAATVEAAKRHHLEIASEERRVMLAEANHQLEIAKAEAARIRREIDARRYGNALKREEDLDDLRWEDGADA